MSLKKILLFPVSLMLSAAGCAGIGPNATYDMATTSFNYDPSYNSYMVKMNGSVIGGGFGNATLTNSIKVGEQVITWEESKSEKIHTAKNQVILTKEQLKGKKYLAAHIYPDDTVEIITSNNWPTPTEKGTGWMQRLEKSK
ncbi:hypothetical protein KTH76_09555 [Acinetobacter baumannii]|uniref:hypothetical protein n=1 Tax=Acinetobacter baumannii TaxID=470 RepID=UPI00045379C8|nr:hypothetical protein [Acinetobacter baumannii]EXE36364.1 hypothetical protein J573_3157 [Acinetobacter baumannii 1546444]MCT9289550.1 hypothetical protein [Acinetobacter baumannii]MCV2391215.1 hypothetical protein [Acinetobacter baumannii]MDC4270777.1 hypothetical protein [Acinetobacter baumannii]MDC4302005.1 hypothetical protein [Acinetobacter baumannii]